MKMVKQLLVKCKDIILYGIFGVLSTVVNIVSYWVLAHSLGIGMMLIVASGDVGKLALERFIIMQSYNNKSMYSI